MEIVIVKLTGNSASPQSGSGRAVVKQAKRLVQQFGYEQQGIGVASANELVLRVEFDARVLGEEMRSNRLALWGKERPETLVWLVLDDTNGRNILEANDPHEIMRVMKDRARVRGIPIAFPVADIADTIALPDELSSVALAKTISLHLSACTCPTVAFSMPLSLDPILATASISISTPLGKFSSGMY